VTVATELSTYEVFGMTLQALTSFVRDYPEVVLIPWLVAGVLHLMCIGANTEEESAERTRDT